MKKPEIPINESVMKAEKKISADSIEVMAYVSANRRREEERRKEAKEEEKKSSRKPALHKPSVAGHESQ
jgi:hypothetical protein